MMSETENPAIHKRTRLSPEIRREQLLDSAQKIISEHGLSSLTMEQVAKYARVSNPLVYKYFDTRLSMLQELLVREFNRFASELNVRLQGAKNFSEAVEICVQVNFDQAEGNNILTTLLHESEIHAEIASAERLLRDKVINILMTSLNDLYPVTPTKAARMLTMAVGVSRAAAESYRQQGGQKDKQIQEAKSFIMAGIATIAQR